MELHPVTQNALGVTIMGVIILAYIVYNYGANNAAVYFMVLFICIGIGGTLHTLSLDKLTLDQMQLANKKLVHKRNLRKSLYV